LVVEVAVVVAEQWQLIIQTLFIAEEAAVLLVALTMQMEAQADTELALTQNQVLVGLAKTLT
jgi:hypothetical protein